MRILARYVCLHFLRLFGLGLFCFLNIYLIVEFIEKVDDLIENQASLANSAAYFLYKVPMILYLVTPVAILLSAVLSLLVLGRNNELTAMRACGVSLYRISAPILGMGFLASGVLLLGNELVIPYTNKKVNQVFRVLIKKQAPRGVVRKDNIWFRSEDRAIWNIRYFDPDQDLFKGVTLYRLTPQHTLFERIDAKTVRWEGGECARWERRRCARWKGGGWKFLDGQIRTFGDGMEPRTEAFSERWVRLPEQPEDFKQVRKLPEEMSLVEIRHYIQGLRANGIDATKYTVDMHAKLSFPLVGFIMALVAVPFSLKTARSGGLALSLGVTLIIGFSYFVLFYTGLSLGHAGTLPPPVAAWATNVLFIAAGLYLMASVRG